ncbi:alpha/beta hydrolase [Lactobacillus psittaci]|uniref:alpha/beta hydrolase n=1 Tax=Lactobacillus psittaci TaxID=116089 RepID=UPI00041EC4FE|nr:alpha/beta hydrolase [Lactobacillus psittaci]
MKNHKKLAWILSGLILLIIIGLGTFMGLGRNQPTKAAMPKATATVFFHGWGSSRRAEEQMANYLVKKKYASSIVVADVDYQGHVKFSGILPAKTKHFIVEVNLQNNKSVSPNGGMTYSQSSNYVADVLASLKKKWKINNVNLVAHSMGNLQVIYFIKNHARSKKYPKINKLVAIAGHYNGIIGMDEPKDTSLEANGKPKMMNDTYRDLLSVRNTFPKNIKVMNIYGNYKNHGDGSVNNNSSKSLRYLVQKRAKSYEEQEIRGYGAQHSRLHENKEVDQVLLKFLK